MSRSAQDTAPLTADQLSTAEIHIISEIEDRLKIAILQPSEPSERHVRNLHVPLLKRQPRALFLDGERGSGKTSVLLTLMMRWRGEWKEDDVEGLNAPSCDPFVIGNVDFDPLPPGMPLLGGMVQAWKPLVEAIENVALRCDDQTTSLLDRWHSLFRMAVSGWSEVKGSSGLIEQILDREAQVQDWLKFSEKWRDFINFVTCEAVKHGAVLDISSNPVFVIVVDDCDLQVGRVTELLPALRNLYHERVFFLVAGDKRHMIDMLKLDFSGQQARLGHDFNPNMGTSAELVRQDWASELARSSFEKVFPRGNQWRLEKLSLRQFISYPKQPGSKKPGKNTFYSLLSSLPLELPPAPSGDASTPPDRTQPRNAGDFIREFAIDADEAKLPGVMTYRAIQQLYDAIFANEARDAKGAGLQILEALFSEGAANERVTIDATDGLVDLSFTGEISALFRPKAIEFSRFDVVFGTRADFSFLRYGSIRPVRMSQSPRELNWTALLTAKALEEAKGPVDAAGIRWDTYLSLAWTEWQRPGASFSWDRHRHPRPDELLRQAQEWAACVRELGGRADLDKFGYAWIYYQLRWNTNQPIPADLAPERISGPPPWDAILKLSPTEDAGDWKNVTLPLLARPEIGLSGEVQSKLLARRAKAKDHSLAKVRRRLVRNAVFALAAQRGDELPLLPDATLVEGFITEIEEDYVGKNSGKHSPWYEQVEANAKKSGNNNT